MDLSAVMNEDDATPPRAADAESAATTDTETHHREYEALRKAYVAADQEREELSGRYAELTARLDRIGAENEFLLSELSYYEPSDLESDQSDIEFVTARPAATPRAKRASPATRKPKSKPKPVASPEDEDTASTSSGPTTKRKRPAPSVSRPKKVPAKKKAAATDE